MALTVERVALLTAGGCLILALAYVPPDPVERARRPLRDAVPEQARVNRLNALYGRTEEQLADWRFHDSLARVLRGRGANAPSVEVRIKGELPPSARALVENAVHNIWTSISPLPGTRLVVIFDATLRPHPTAYALPGALDGRTCVATVARGWGVRWLHAGVTDTGGTNLQPWLREAIAPCLYFGAFGQPGPHIERWLYEQSFRPANSADWVAAPAPLRVAETPGYDFLFSNGTFDALACTHGKTARCYRALTPPRPKPERASLIARRAYWSRGFIADHYYLAALVREMGRERFAQFWRSPAPLDSAFQAAFAQSIDAWTARWARSTVPDLPPFGPAPRPRAVLFGVGFGALAIALCAAFVIRRQVG